MEPQNREQSFSRDTQHPKAAQMSLFCWRKITVMAAIMSSLYLAHCALSQSNSSRAQPIVPGQLYWLNRYAIYIEVASFYKRRLLLIREFIINKKYRLYKALLAGNKFHTAMRYITYLSQRTKGFLNLMVF